MLVFSLLALVLIAVALGFILPPLLRTTDTQTEVDRKQMNVAIFQERLAELQDSLRDPAHLAQARAELARDLLHDTQAPTSATPLRQVRSAGILVALLLPLLTIGIYLYTGSLEALEPTQSHENAVMGGDMAQAIRNLQAKLESNPEQVDNWAMLGRTYMAMDRYSEAASAFDQVLLRTKSPSPRLLTDAAEAFGLANQGDLSGRPARLIAQALEQQADFPKALWLAGMAAMQQKAYPKVITAWEKLLTLMPPDAQERELVEQHLQQVKQHLQADNDAPKSTVSPAVAQATTPAPSETLPSDALSPKARIQVTVQLAPDFHPNPDDTLFISARAAQGPRMPLAVVRKQARDLPLTVTLDDSLSMIPGMTLSAFSTVVVSARISAQGKATLQSGDLFGESAPLPAAQWDQPVTVTIDHQMP